MWLLKLHFAVSVLCLITFIGFRTVFREVIKDNGWFNEDKKRKKILTGYLVFFVPILNIFSVIIMLIMVSMKKKDFDKMCEDAKKNSEVSDND